MIQRGRIVHCVAVRTSPVAVWVAVHSLISRLLPLLRVAISCTVLRSRWCQSGVNISLASTFD
jgi:hypothetical protein